MDEVVIRDARAQDLPALLEIYNEVLVSSTAIWTDDPRTLPAHEAWFAARTERGLPVLVVTIADRVAGYCTYGPFRAWSGYDKTVESSIYMAPAHRTQGLGTELLAALIERGRIQDFHVMIAGIDADNTASIRLHTKLGFTQAGHLHQVGRKFGRWLDLVFFERRLAPAG